MRLKTSIFVSAVMRQETSCGAFSMILNKGAEEAGAVFLVHLMPGGKADLYGPAPQAVVDENNEGDRWFELLGKELSSQDLETRLQSQLKFDPDCWIVEIEKSGPLESIHVVSET